MTTGGTAGSGVVAARELAAKGAAVVIVGGDAAKGSRAVADIGRQTGNDRVHFVRADLSSQAEVRRVARDFVEGDPRLDVRVNHAGAPFTARQLPDDGTEKTLAIDQPPGRESCRECVFKYV